MVRRPLLRAAILLPAATAAIVLAWIASHMHPPAGSVARECVATAAGLLIVNLVAWAARDGARFGREERLWAFVAFAAVAMGYSFAREAIAEREFDSAVAAQQRDLAVTAAALSHEILAFVDGRSRLSPPPPHNPDTWERDEAAWAAFERETVSEYTRLFSRRVRAARAALTFRNLRDRDLDALYQTPGNTFQVRIVGERIGALAQRLQRAITPS